MVDRDQQRAFFSLVRILCLSWSVCARVNIWFLDSILPVPLDVTGYPETIVDQPPADPAPFNHPTKIAVLKVFRKDQQK